LDSTALFAYFDITTDIDSPPSRAKPSVCSQHGGEWQIMLQ